MSETNAHYRDTNLKQTLRFLYDMHKIDLKYKGKLYPKSNLSFFTLLRSYANILPLLQKNGNTESLEYFIRSILKNLIYFLIKLIYSSYRYSTCGMCI